MNLKLPAELLNEAPGERVVFTGNPESALTAALGGRRRIALFTGRKSAESGGSLDRVTAAIRGAGGDFRRFSEIAPEPDTATVAAMTAFLDDFRPEAVVALGGGSVMDAAKAALLVRQTGRKLEELFGVNAWSSQSQTPPERIIALPTTSGTGSEATPYSNIVDPGSGVKRLISEEAIVPETAIVTPEFAATMPRRVALATGCDALAHLIEGFLNVGADRNHPRANIWAREGIRLATEALQPRISAGADPETVRALALASTLGGMTIRFKSTGLPHLCSFSWFGRIEHGIAAIMLLPAAWRYYLANPAVAERTMELAEFFPGRTPDEVICAFRRFLDRLGVPARLSDFPGITPELLAATARSGAQNRMKLELAPCPVPLERSEEILSRLLEAAYSGSSGSGTPD